MPDAPRLKVAFIGSHGVGKTTLCYGLAARLKARDVAVDVVHEIARRCPLPINEETGVASESWILHTQIGEELIAQARYPVVICDRSVLDNYVYLLLAAGKQPHLEGLVDGWMRGYDLLFHVPIVEEPSPDGVRSADPAFQTAVDRRLEEELAARGLAPQRLDPARRGEWLERVDCAVWERLRPAQMRLPQLRHSERSEAALRSAPAQAGDLSGSGAHQGASQESGRGEPAGEAPPPDPSLRSG